MATATQLAHALVELNGAQEVNHFLSDLLTPQERAAIEDRWLVAQLVSRGLTYREIAEQTGVSTATITRVGRALNFGDGGYRLVLERIGSVKPTAKNHTTRHSKQRPAKATPTARTNK